MKKGKLGSTVLMLLALAAAAAGVWLSFFGQGRSALLLGDAADPADTVQAFFTAVCAGHYDEANALLSGYSTLGLENEPADENARALWALVRGGCEWESVGEARREGLCAEQDVVFRTPDADALLDGIDTDVNTLLARRVEDARRSEEIYNDDGSYRREVVLAVYDEALAARLGGEVPQRSFSLTAELEYQDGVWKITPTRALLTALSGGLE